jgi:hypothetical protein
MAYKRGIAIVAVMSLCIAGLTSIYVVNKVNTKPPRIDILPKDQIDKLRQRGEVGAIKARILEIGNKSTLAASDIETILAVVRDPVSFANSLSDSPDDQAHDWSEDEIQSTRVFALVEMLERLRTKTVDVTTQKLFEDTMISCITDGHPHMRNMAIRSAGQLGLIRRPEVRAIVSQLIEDPDPNVAKLALKALDSNPEASPPRRGSD